MGSTACAAASNSCANRRFCCFDGLVRIALAEAEARAGDVERAITTIDEALETVDRTGCRAFEAALHRVRGEMLLKRDRANFPPAEEALHSDIAIAKQQAARSFSLRAALSLAKLYQSTGPSRRRPRRPRARARRVFADARNAGDR